MYNQQRKGGCGPLGTLVILGATVFGFIFMTPQSGNTTNAPGWYQTVENVISPIGHQLDQRFAPKAGRIETRAGVLSWH